VTISTKRLNRILPIGDDGLQVLCFSGAGIFDLQAKLAQEYKRDSHSVLGSIFLNPSVGAGVAFGSGGTQIRKGPVYTDRALYCKVSETGEVTLVDTTGLLGDDVLTQLETCERLDKSDFDPSNENPCSYPDYVKHVTTLNGDVARYNADTCGCDCNRSEGKVMILASIHDTYPEPSEKKLVWVSCKDFQTTNAVKTEVCLSSMQALPRSCEYMDRDTFDAVDQGSRIGIKLIEVVGMNRLKFFWDVKEWIGMLPLPFAGIFCDKFLYVFNNVLPESLPPHLMRMGRSFDHHLLMELAEYSPGELKRLQEKLDACVASRPAGAIEYRILDPAESGRAMLYRFTVASAFRTCVIGRGLQGLSIDYALPKNCVDAPVLPEKQYPSQGRCRYSHFGCNVVHEDIYYGPEVDTHDAKMEIKRAIEAVGGKLPAEHGHGTEYTAPLTTQKRWMSMDPLNVMNPGVGGLSYSKSYGRSTSPTRSTSTSSFPSAVHA
jgi:D-lactate dehydrogenase